MTVLLVVVVMLLGAGVLTGLGYRRLRQRRTASALEIHSPEGITEERLVWIGGVEQWIQIRGENRRNPIILMLHGGPGWPNAMFTLPLRPWEEHFTIVQWDHRGAGKSRRRNGKPSDEEMTFEQRITDTVDVTEYLLAHLDQDKLILLAESMGTLTGIPVALQRPDLFSALVVTDLYVNMIRNESTKRDLTMQRLKDNGNEKGVAQLEAIGSEPSDWDMSSWNKNMVWAFKTNLPDPNPDRRVLFPLLLTSPLYTLHDIFTLIAGFQSTTTQMLGGILRYDARQHGTRFGLPFFLIQGESDVITLTDLAVEYFHEVTAPTKELALIQNAGHFAAFTQPEQFLAALLTHVRPIAVSRQLA